MHRVSVVRGEVDGFEIVGACQVDLVVIAFLALGIRRRFPLRSPVCSPITTAPRADSPPLREQLHHVLGRDARMPLHCGVELRHHLVLRATRAFFRHVGIDKTTIGRHQIVALL